MKCVILGMLADISYERFGVIHYEFKLRFLEVIHMKRMFHMKGLG